MCSESLTIKFVHFKCERVMRHTNTGELITVALRPSIMYGEEDHLFFPTMAKVARKFGGVIPKVLGAGGKHQQAYVGMYFQLNLIITVTFDVKFESKHSNFLLFTLIYACKPLCFTKYSK